MEKQKKIIKILEFTSDPGPRYIKQGDDSGELYYHSILNKQFYEVLQNNQILVVDLDGPSGYASSFLDEAFGNLIYDFGKELVLKHLEIISEEEPEWIEMLENESYEEWEERRKTGTTPKKTEKHSAWYRFINNNMEHKVWS